MRFKTLAFFITAATLLATWLQVAGPGPFGSLAGLLSLASENNAGTWWSGFLLLLAGILAADGYDAHESAPVLARSWTVICLGCLALSATELASIHERIALLGPRFGLHEEIVIAPFVLVGGALMAAACFGLYRDEKGREAVLPIVVALALFGSVRVQERFEHAIDWSSPGIEALRTVVEEGTELVATFLLLFATSKAGADRVEPLSAVRKRGGLALGLSVTAFLIALGLGLILRESRGDMLLRAAAMGSFTLAAVSWKGPARWIALAASMGAVAIRSEFAFDPGSFDVNRSGEGLGLLLPFLAAAAIAVALIVQENRFIIAAQIALISLTLPWWTTGDGFVAAALAAWIATLTLLATLHRSDTALLS